MENQRLILIVALVFILFLIWQAWMEEQMAKRPQPVAAAPGATTQQPAADRDAVPTQQDVPGVELPAVAPSEPERDSGTRIQVMTDVFNVEIDAIGGDIRFVGLLTYPESLQDKDQPFVLMQDSPVNFFVAQSGLVSTSGPAPNHHDEYVPEQTEYRLEDGQDKLDVRLTWTHESGLKVIKTYTFYRGNFVVDVSHEVVNETPEQWTGSQYRQLQRTPPLQTNSFLSGGAYTYTGGVISTPEERYQKVSFDDMAEENLKLQNIEGGWVAMIQHYFVGAWVPDEGAISNFYSEAVSGNRYVLGMVSQLQSSPSGGSVTFTSRIYAGPKIQDRLEAIAPNLRLTVDYGFLTIIAQPLFWLLKWIYEVVGNWGWAIIILTILIKAVFFKLSETSYRSMANMRRLAPEFNRLKERYGSDRQKLNQAMMDLYKKEEINPLGGCLPILVQIPVFIALYWMLLESVELRQAPFMLWIQDLSTKDPYFVLPLIMGASMFIQQKLNPAPPDPIQAKVMMALPIVFTVFFLWFPSGLVLYWVVNNVLSIAQQYVITKRVEAGASTQKA